MRTRVAAADGPVSSRNRIGTSLHLRTLPIAATHPLVAARIRGAPMPGDGVASLGGDAFTVLLLDSRP